MRYPTELDIRIIGFAHYFYKIFCRPNPLGAQRLRDGCSTAFRPHFPHWPIIRHEPPDASFMRLEDLPGDHRLSGLPMLYDPALLRQPLETAK
jgi:hypothetical protein